MRRHILACATVLALLFGLTSGLVRSGSIQPLTSGSGSGSGTVTVSNSGGATSSASILRFNQPLFQTTSGVTSTVDVFQANPSGQQQLAIPMYIDPNVTPAAWTTVTAGAPRVGLLVANPASGPGAAQDAVYLAAINAAKAAGVIVLGYVPTNFGATASATVTGQVDSWYTFYGIDGIFFDQVATSPTNIPYYTNLYSYVRAKSVNHLVCLNPGTDTDEGYAAISDILLDFENTYAAYTAYTPPAWTRKYSPRKFWHCVHTTTAANAANAILLGKQDRAYWVNFTDDVLANPYDTLATYFSTEIPAIGFADGTVPQVSGSFALNGVISPTQITADQNDYNPTGLSAASQLRLSTDASRNITGLQGGVPGRIVTILNVGSFDIVLVSQSASSSATNRFGFGTSQDLTLASGHACILQYDSSSRWRQLGATRFGSTGTGTTAALSVSPTFTGTVNTAALTVAGASTLTATNATFQAADRGRGFVCTGTAGSTIVNTLEEVVVSDGTSGVRLTSVSGTVNSGTAGPNLNGRDQNTAFASGVWVYEYAIGGNGLTSGYVLSTSATAPTLTGALAGYKASKPLTAYFSTASGAILLSFVHYGNWTLPIGVGNIIGAGTATTFGAGTSAASSVPPSANLVMVSGVISSSTTTAHNTTISYDGTNTYMTYVTSQVLNIPSRGGPVIMPILAQTLYYAVTGAGDSYNETILAWAFPTAN